MRIAFLCTSGLDFPSPRGRWLPLAHELAALGYDPQLLMLHHTYDRLPRAARHDARAGVGVRYVGQMHVYGPVGQRQYFGPAALLRVSLLGMLALLRETLRLRPDVVHVCKPQPINGLAGLLAARALRRPLFVDCDDYEAGGNRFGAAWQRRMVELWEDRLPLVARGVTVNTRFLEQRNRALGVAAERIVYVPNGIAAERLAAAPARAVAGLRGGLGLTDAPVVLYVGTLSQTTHNVGLLLDAFALVAARLPSARLLLVGDGEDRAALQRRSVELGIAAQTLFAGPVPAAAVAAFLTLASCSVDPVGDDGVARGRSPLKIVESLAVGVPVVTGDVGDRAAMLGPDGGVLVAPGDAAALAAGIRQLLEDQSLRARLALGARTRAEHYRWDRLAPIWAEVYG